METRFKLLGHPVHPMLIVFPLGLLSTAVLFDLLYLITREEQLAVFSFWAMAAGVAGGLGAALFGLIDWLAIPRDTRARSIGLLHGGGNVVVVLLFAISWFLRLDDPAFLPNVLPLILGLAGAGIALFTAWLGGELVYRLGVAVDTNAHLDAPNSLRQSGVAHVQDPGEAQR
jgi:uncharacterized membrane protein